MRGTHPLFGQLLEATAFKRWRGVLNLVVTLPDGSSGTIHADATNVFGEDVDTRCESVLTADGFRHLRTLVDAMHAGQNRRKTRQRK
jgi:hypothetical protein